MNINRAPCFLTSGADVTMIFTPARAGRYSAVVLFLHCFNLSVYIDIAILLLHCPLAITLHFIIPKTLNRIAEWHGRKFFMHLASRFSLSHLDFNILSLFRRILSRTFYSSPTLHLLSLPQF